MMAGPCSVESRDQLFETADAVAAAGATILRGGAFKPRTSPYAFQGLGVEALRYLAEARDRTGLPVITEVMEPNQVDIVAEYADILQIGTRNMQNYSLLRDVGRVARPVMLKRGFGATVEEWLMAAEYIVSAGNPNVILCERGIRTFETYTRNTMDLAAVPLLHHLTHLPVIVDPSPRHRQALAGQAARARRRRGRRGRGHGRGPPAPRRGALRRRAAADLRAVRRPDGRDRRRSTSTSASLHGDLLAASDAAGHRRRRAVEALIDRRRRHASARPRACAATLRLPGDKSISHRALLLAALAEGESRIAGAGDGADVRSTAGIVAALGAERRARRRATGRPSTIASSRPGRTACAQPARRSTAATPGRASRLIGGHARRAAADRDARRRRFVARPSDGSYHRAAALDGRGAPRPSRTIPCLR